MAKPTNTVITVATLLFMLLVMGCAESSDKHTSNLTADLYSSPAALLDQYNLITTRDPVDIAAAYDLCYAENEFQRRYISASRTTAAFAELDRVMFQTFGECFDPRRKVHLLAPDQPATLTRQDNERAEAKYVNSQGESKILYLVRIGTRWWVSGFTFQYEAGMPASESDLDRLERLTHQMSAAASEVIERIRGGQIVTAEQARESIKEALPGAK